MAGLLTAVSADISPALTEFISGVEENPDLIACYLTGSYAEGYSIHKISDIDLTIITSGPFPTSDQSRLIERINEKYDVSLDVSNVRKLENQTDYLADGIGFREAVISAKLAGNLIWGKDILRDFLLPDAAHYVASTEKIPFEFSNRIRNYAGLKFPLGYPDPDDAYFGYLGKAADGSPSTKPLISLYTWLGTATIAKLSAIPIGNKQQCVSVLTKLRPDMGHELSDVFDACRKAWGYRVPDTASDQTQLKAICSRALAWENRYRDEFFPGLT